MSELDQTEFQSYGPRHAADLVGHGAAERNLLEAWRSGRLPHAWLITGPKGIGKATLAFRFARFVLAANETDAPADSLEMSADHPVFRRVAGFAHPGLLTVERGWNEKTKRWRTETTVDEVRRMGPFFAMSAAPGGWRVCVIDAADDMNRNAANAALKLIEEPPRRGLILLVSHAPGRLLPTLRSRCRRLALQPLDESDVAEVVSAHRPDLPAADAAEVARLAEGSAGQAMALADAGAAELNRSMDDLLAGLPEIDVVALNGFAEKLARPNAEAAYRAVADLLRRWLGGVATAGAGGPRTAGSAETIGARLDLARRLALWDKVTGLLDKAEPANLDKKQVLISAFLAIAKAMRA